jgi:hypothetical protein
MPKLIKHNESVFLNTIEEMHEIFAVFKPTGEVIIGDKSYIWDFTNEKWLEKRGKGGKTNYICVGVDKVNNKSLSIISDKIIEDVKEIHLVNKYCDDTSGMIFYKVIQNYAFEDNYVRIPPIYLKLFEKYKDISLKIVYFN